MTPLNRNEKRTKFGSIKHVYDPATMKTLRKFFEVELKAAARGACPLLDLSSVGRLCLQRRRKLRGHTEPSCASAADTYLAIEVDFQL